jgi:hypothetical protein
MPVSGDGRDAQWWRGAGWHGVINADGKSAIDEAGRESVAGRSAGRIFLIKPDCGF